MSGLKEKERIAIERLKAFEPETEPYFLCYSGGKDSDVIRILAALANVKHEIHHSLTTVDAPETIQYIKSIPNVIIDKARWKDGRHKTMWNLIPYHKMPPTRAVRYCCEELKERGGKGRLKITGVRAEESKERAERGGEINIVGRPKTTQKYLNDNEISHIVNKQNGIILNFDNSDSRRAVEHCYRTTSTMINPILDWSEDEVWDFLHHYGCEGNPLYQCGANRIGCIGCPLAGDKQMKKELKQYPQFNKAYIRAFDKMLIEREKAGKENYSWTDGESVMKWWLQCDTDQLVFDGFDIMEL